MSTIVIWCKKILITVLVVAFGLGPVPVASVYALGVADPGNPPAANQAGDRLPKIWARERAVYNRLGKFLKNADGRLTRAQELIDKASANGRDVSAIQAALDAFTEAVRKVRPTYDAAGGIVSAHQGFDANGNVIDQTRALQTVKDLGEDLKQIRQPLIESGKALREAVKAFRQANRPGPTQVPYQNSG